MSGSFIEFVRERVEYNPETGEFTAKQYPKSKAKPGRKLGGYRDGYVRISIGGKLYSAHRLAWLLTYGEEPGGMIDHINRVKDDNRIKNLRVVSNAENQQNVVAARRNSKSGLIGVQCVKGRYAAYIWHSGSQRFVGSYGTPEEASAAYFRAKQQHHQGYAK